LNSTAPEPNLSKLLGSRISAGDFPSAVYLVAENGAPVFADALGDAVVIPTKHPATLETIYDLASLTKPLVTGLLCAKLIEAETVSLDDLVANYLAEFDRPEKNAITIRQLVTHTSGLPAWRPLYLLTTDKDSALSAIAEESLEYQPGTRVVYSDLGFIALGLLIQHVMDTSLIDLAQREIFGPLNLRRTFFNPERAMQTGVAACESGNAYERDVCERGYATRPYRNWRSNVVWGEVHDGNAHFLGGAAGHAGLFATAADTLTLANQFIAE